MWKRLQRFRKLDFAARRLFLRAVVLLPVIALSLRLRGFVATQTALQRFLSGGTTDRGKKSTDKNVCSTTAASKEVGRTVRMVRAAADYGIGHPTCLEQSLALWWLLGRQGIASSVRIGAHKAAGGFAAHAWVECDDIAVNEGDELHAHYAVFDAAFPAQQSLLR